MGCSFILCFDPLLFTFSYPPSLPHHHNRYNEFFNGIKEHIPAQSGDSEVNYDQVLKDADQILEEGNVEEAAKMYSEVFESHNTKGNFIIISLYFVY